MALPKLTLLAGALALLLPGGVAAAAPAPAPPPDVIWLEAETPAACSVKPEIGAWGHVEFFSAGKWLQIRCAADKVETDFPAAGALLRYEFKAAVAARYEVWNRIGYEFVRSPFAWRLDGGSWQTVAPTELTTDCMEFSLWNELAWLKLADRDLTVGPHNLEIQVPRALNDKGQPAKVLYASDVICLTSGRFHPNGRCRPGAEERDAHDADAARQVFILPTPAGDGARSRVELAGLWEVCRYDEQLPGEVAAPIQGFPEEPHWKAIPVPGDKNTLRPDLELAHRLWYRTRVRIPPGLERRSFQIVFPQNNLNTTVRVNGVDCGFGRNPFAAFTVDVTKAVRPGDNEILVGMRDAWYGYSANPKDPLKLRRVWNLPRKFLGEGWQDLAYPIWNHAQSGILVTPSFVAAGPAYAADVFCKPSVARHELAVELRIANPGAAPVTGEVRWAAVGAVSGVVEKEFPPQPFAVAAGAEAVVNLAGAWEKPRLWWPDDPYLYRLRTSLVVAGQPVDVAETTFGFREWSWAGRDFRLNGIVWHGWADCHTAATPDAWLAFYRKTNQRMTRFWGTHWLGLTPDAALDFWDRNGVVVRRSGVLDGEGIGYFAVERDPDLQKLYSSPLKIELLRNWREQVVAQVKGERNHPSIMIWSLENEWLFINCFNLYGNLLDGFEAEIAKTAQAVQAADPTRPVMIDGGGALKSQALPVHGDHYIVGKPEQYPDLAYQAQASGGGRGRWSWDQQRPRFLGEDYFMTGNHPEVACFEGESAFAGKPVRGVAMWERILQEGYRWAGFGAWQFWLGQDDTDQSQYVAFAPRAVFCRQWDWTFASGAQVPRMWVVFNDSRDPAPLTFAWTLEMGGKRVAGGSRVCPVPPGGRLDFELPLAVPTTAAPRAESALVLTLTANGREVFRDVKAVSVLNPRHAPGAAAAESKDAMPRVRQVLVFDPRGSVAAALTALRQPFSRATSLDTLPPSGDFVLVIGHDALDAQESTSCRLAALAALGARVVVLEQTQPLRFQGLPAELEPDTNQGFTAFLEDAGHPVAWNLQDKDFFTWGPATPVYRNAYRKRGSDSRSLVQCHELLRSTALAEVPVGKGLLLLCQLQVGANLDRQVAARQLLLNLVDYAGAFRRVENKVAVAADDAPRLLAALDALGLQHSRVPDPLVALDPDLAKIAIVSATPENLKTLAGSRELTEFLKRGGTLMLHGLTPAGLGDYNRIVSVEHMIRPFRRERVLLAPQRDQLMAGLTAGDVVLYSAERIFSWTAGNYVVSDLFSYVVDYDEVAPFGKSPFFAYANITNGFVSADGWPLIINFPAPKAGTPFAVPIAFDRPQTFTEFTWIGNTFYWPQTRVNLVFDGRRDAMLSWPTAPTNAPQTFPITPPRPARELTLEIADWTPLADKAPNIGIDNIYLKVQRPPEFYQTVKPLLNVGGLMRYVKGPGQIVLCNLLFKGHEDVPENEGKKERILATLLRNLQAPFVSNRALIAGAGLRYEPVVLAGVANRFRDARGWFGDPAFTFRDLPSGEPTLAGVRFAIPDAAKETGPTAVMLAGPGVPGRLPAEVRGIAVNRRADALFFLLAGHLDRRRSEADIRAGRRWEACRFQVHYADGETADVPVYAEIDLEEFRQTTPVAVPGSQIAWTRPCGTTGFSLVAYCRQWNNPRPQIEIKSIDFLPGAERCATPALLALTTALAAEPPPR